MKNRFIITVILLWLLLSGASLPLNSFDNLNGLTGRFCIRDIAQSADGMIWLAAESGLYSYDGFRIVEHRYYDNDTVVRNLGSFNCMIACDDSLIIGCNNGVLSFGLRDYKFKKLDYARTEIVSDIECADGSIWVSTDKGLYRDGNKLPVELTGIVSIESDSANLYIGMLNSVKKYSFVSGNIYEIEGGWNYVASILEIDSCVWVGTGGVVSRISKSDGSVLESHKVSVAKTIFPTGDGNILVGTDDGLCVFGSKGVERYVHDVRNRESLSGNIVWSIFEDRDGNIWIGTDAGISLMPADDLLRVCHLPDLTGEGRGNTLFCVCVDRQNRIWLGGNSGLICVENHGTDTSSYRWYRMGDASYPIFHNRIRCMLELSDGAFLVGGDMGIMIYDEQSQKFVNLPMKNDTGKRNWVYDIRECENGDIEITTFSETFTASLGADRRSIVVKSVSARRNMVPYAGAADSILYSYGLNDDYISVFNDSIRGRILLGGKDKFAIIDDVSAFHDNSCNLQLTGIRVNDSFDVPHRDIMSAKVVLGADTKFIEVMFSDFKYSGSRNLKYQYRLDGGEWIPLKNTGYSVLLTDIKSGSHSLEVALSDDYATAAVLNFSVKPQWYASPIAILIYCMAGLFLVWLLWHILYQRAKMSVKVRKYSEILQQVKEREELLSTENKRLDTQLKLRLNDDSGEMLTEDEKFMKKITLLIDENISNPDFNVAMLGEMSGIAGKQLYRKIKNITGMTAVSYLRYQRMIKAASLLERGGLTVAEVMYAVGFTNPSYFSRCFQSTYGVPPSEYIG